MSEELFVRSSDSRYRVTEARAVCPSRLRTVSVTTNPLPGAATAGGLDTAMVTRSGRSSAALLLATVSAQHAARMESRMTSSWTQRHQGLDRGTPGLG